MVKIDTKVFKIVGGGGGAFKAPPGSLTVWNSPDRIGLSVPSLHNMRLLHTHTHTLIYRITNFHDKGNIHHNDMIVFNRLLFLPLKYLLVITYLLLLLLLNLIILFTAGMHTKKWFRKTKIIIMNFFFLNTFITRIYICDCI